MDGCTSPHTPGFDFLPCVQERQFDLHAKWLASIDARLLKRAMRKAVLVRGMGQLPYAGKVGSLRCLSQPPEFGNVVHLMKAINL